MARIAGVDLPRDKRVEIGLTYIFGIGLTTSRKLLGVTGINGDTRVSDLTEEEVHELWTRPRLEVYAEDMGVEFRVSSLGEDGTITCEVL